MVSWECALRALYHSTSQAWQQHLVEVGAEVAAVLQAQLGIVLQRSLRHAARALQDGQALKSLPVD